MHHSIVPCVQIPAVNVFTNSWLNFNPHYVTTIGMYLHLVEYQTGQGILNVSRDKQDNEE